MTVPWFEFGDDEAEVCSAFQRAYLRPGAGRGTCRHRPPGGEGLGEELAAFTADWFGEVLRLPTLEYDGRRDGPPAVT